MALSKFVTNNNRVSVKIAFMFSGIGVQWEKMGSELLSTESVFRQKIEECDQLLSKYADWSIVEEITKDKSHSRVNDTLIAHPCNFSIQVALVELLRSWGLEPEGVVGNSAGEVAACWTAGVLDLEHAIHVIWQQRMLIENLIGKGKVIHVSLPEEKLQKYLDKYREQIIIAAKNSPKATLLSGSEDILMEIITELQNQNVFCSFLNVDVPYHHTSTIEPYKNDFYKAITNIKVHSANIPIYSAWRGTLSKADDYNCSYWPKHFSEKIHFGSAIKEMIQDRYNVFIEIGVHPALLRSVYECFQEENNEDHLLLHTLRRRKNEKNELLNTLATLHVSGYPIQWNKLNKKDQIAGKSIVESIIAGNKYNINVQTLKKSSRSERKKMLLNFIKELTSDLSGEKIDNIDTQTGFFEMGLTSLSALQLQQILTQKLQIKLSVAIMFNYPNIDVLVEYLDSRLNGSNKSSAYMSEVNPKRAATNRNVPLAIVGIACRFPGDSDNPDAFWNTLINGKNGRSEIPRQRWDINNYYDPDPAVPGKTHTRWGNFLKDSSLSQFDADFFKISPKEMETLDPQQRLLLEVSWEAFENAGISFDYLNDKQVGVYVGICSDEFKGIVLYRSDLNKMNQYTGMGTMFSCAAGRLSYFLNLNGPNLAVDTACSSSMVALDIACKALRNNDTDIALLSGVNLLALPNLFVFFTKLGALSPDGKCKTFDALADGYSRGEGCGAVILKRLPDALADGDNILSLVRGTAVNHDGASTSFTAPNGDSQQKLIYKALNDANVKPEEVGFVEAHGTGTSLGDSIEVNVIGDVYGKCHDQENPLLLGSVKPNIGHLEGAAGMSSLIKVILALKNELIPPQIYFHTPNPNIPWDNKSLKVPKKTTPWTRSNKPRLVGINSFGFSGTNVHAILEEAPQKKHKQSIIERPSHILTFSAKNKDSLYNLATLYETYLIKTEESIENICYTANVGRNHFNYRFAFHGTTKENLVEKVSSSKTKLIHSNIKSDYPNIVFLFTGQGSQYKGMGKILYETQPLFKKAFDRCDDLFSSYTDLSLAKLLYSDFDNDNTIDQTFYTQTTLFSIEYALSELWLSWGVKPFALIGHSIGEYVAAYIAGVFSLEDAVKLVAIRSNLMQSLPQGGMMAAVFADENTVIQAIGEHKKYVCAATINAPENIVISGDKTCMLSVLKRLENNDIKYRPLKVSHAFHSPMTEPILDKFRNEASKINYSQPGITIISNVTGKPAKGTDLICPEYWTNHIRHTVRFHDCIKFLETSNIDAFLEIGPKPILTLLGKQCLPDNDEIMWLPSLKFGKNDWNTMLESLSALYLRGAKINWQKFDAPYERQKVVLPSYPFNRKKYDIKKFETLAPHAIKNYHPLIGKRITSPALKETIIFESIFNKLYPKFISEHVIYNKMISPGAAHLSMVLSAASQLKNYNAQDSIVIEEISFLIPLVVKENEDRKVQIILDNISNTEIPFRIVSCELPGEDWVIHCEGNLNVSTSEEGKHHKKLLDFPEFSEHVKPQKCKDHIKGYQFYETLLKNAMDLSKNFQCIEQSWYGDNEALCQINAGGNINLSEGIYPGLIDSLIQTSISSLNKLDELNSKNQVIIPLNISDLKLYGNDFKDKSWWVYTRNRQKDDIINSDIAVRNALGVLIMEIRGLRLKVTNSRSLFKNINTNENLFYSIEWEKREISRPTDNISSYLIFSDEKGTGNQLSQYLARKNISHLQVSKNNLNHDFSQNFIRLFETFEQNNDSEFPNILFLRGLDTILTDDDSVEIMRKKINNLYENLLSFVQSVINYKWKHLPRIWLITRNAWNISQAMHQIEPVQTGIWGIGRVIALEHTDMWGGCIDLDNCESDNWVEALLTAVSSIANNDQIAVRNNASLYVARLKGAPIRNNNPSNKENQFVKSDATYLVTGGLGALGLRTAERLFHCGAKNIVLLGRSTPEKGAKKRIEALKQEGVRIEIFQADVSDETVMAEVFNSIQKNMPPLLGIVHAAGVLDDGILIKQNPMRFNEVLSPKIFGSWNLHLLTKDIPLDFFVMFSSSSAITGNQGQGNYAAANAFMNGLAYYRRTKGLVATSISWGPWAGIGMATSNTNIQDKVGLQGYRLIPMETGLEIFENLIGVNITQISVMDLDVNVFTARNYLEKTDFFSNYIRSKSLSEIQEKTKYNSELVNKLKNAPFEARTENMISFLLEITKQVIGNNNEIISDRPIMDMGFDSLMIMELRNRISSELGKKLPVSILFDYPTLDSLANHLIQNILEYEPPPKKNKSKEKLQDAAEFLNEIEGLI
ncbi:short-chain dehydrogenase [Candidatus Magnetomorum sp. HK-1]|nr:short-chain dehydrogenase [Candidatus Magnetomorum sp. HK-1]